ncbi:type II toxin-antitoxin system Phd/YefM family antitoxin [Marinimicrobium sp. ABcell2]|uniref:type II toxin-antitoxin system Phd/YefM family antitoxin n=1 Tax=Marinimicrobium sp. ABcell2 TaxID=3069751 RepID=UPI0027B4C027|nr:type II toxin-antitoxin system Phd/YefM family antitoxin [Marinimicrobium sp. ABcell2]MDQ2077082.1 type II toxin-antitoxin system Phd/YefM family antitoxin [Marinimicrobium sp. ABcell2]
MNTLTANDLKTRGVSAVEEGLQYSDELSISVRGQQRYVVMSVETYNRLRELELAAAVAEAKADYHAGRYTTESVEEHMKRVRDEL